MTTEYYSRNRDIFEKSWLPPAGDQNFKMATPLISHIEDPNPSLKIVLPEDGTIHVQDDGILRFSIGLSNESDTEGILYKLTTSRDLSTEYEMTASTNPGLIGPGEMIFVKITIKEVDEGSIKLGLKSDMVPQYEMTPFKYKNFFECAVDGSGGASFGVTTSSPGRVLRSGRRSRIGTQKIM